jgi:hypothetical protein
MPLPDAHVTKRDQRTAPAALVWFQTNPPGYLEPMTPTDPDVRDANSAAVAVPETRPGGLALEVPQPEEAPTPVAPDEPAPPVDPDPGTPGDPSEPASVPGVDEPPTPAVPEPAR